MKDHQVSLYVAGVYHSAVSGCGVNRGTMDYTHSKRTATRWAKRLNQTEPKPFDRKFVAEETK